MIKSPKTILRLLKSERTIVRVHELKDGDDKGLVYFETGVIHISNKQQIWERISTLIHECLHILNPYPNLTEKEAEFIILGIEKEVFDKLSQKEYNLLKKFVE